MRERVICRPSQQRWNHWKAQIPHEQGEENKSGSPFFRVMKINGHVERRPHSSQAVEGSKAIVAMGGGPFEISDSVELGKNHMTATTHRRRFR